MQSRFYFTHFSLLKINIPLDICQICEIGFQLVNNQSKSMQIETLFLKFCFKNIMDLCLKSWNACIFIFFPLLSFYFSSLSQRTIFFRSSSWKIISKLCSFLGISDLYFYWQNIWSLNHLSIFIFIQMTLWQNWLILMLWNCRFRLPSSHLWRISDPKLRRLPTRR